MEHKAALEAAERDFNTLLLGVFDRAINYKVKGIGDLKLIVPLPTKKKAKKMSRKEIVKVVKTTAGIIAITSWGIYMLQYTDIVNSFFRH